MSHLARSSNLYLHTLIHATIATKAKSAGTAAGLQRRGAACVHAKPATTTMASKANWIFVNRLERVINRFPSSLKSAPHYYKPNAGLVDSGFIVRLVDVKRSPTVVRQASYIPAVSCSSKARLKVLGQTWRTDPSTSLMATSAYPGRRFRHTGRSSHPPRPPS